MKAARRLGVCLLAFTLVVGMNTAVAAGQFIEDIRVSRTGEEASITIELACPMRFQSDFRTAAGVLLEIRVVPLDDCRQLGISGIANEIHRPVGAQLAHLTEVEYESLGLGENLLLLRFDRAVDYRVTQRGNLRVLELTVELGTDRASVEALDVPDTSRPVPAMEAPVAVAVPAPDRLPVGPRLREPQSTPDYMINLQSTRERTAASLISSLSIQGGKKLYLSETTIDGQTWYRLRLGFFTTEEEARAALEPLAGAFPRAWIGRAEPEEVRAASTLEIEPGDTIVEREAAAGLESLAVPAAPRAAAAALDEARIRALEAEARQAMIDRDFANAIRIYTRLLQQPGEHLVEARELLGLARQRNGQLAHARAEYEQYLQDYPDSEGTQRVRQRLNGLLTVAEAPREPLRRGAEADERWEFRTGVSQYYRRHVDRFDEDQPELVTLSALLSDFDLNVRRGGEVIDVTGRITVNHLYDLVGEEEGGPGDRNRVSYAYVDVNEAQGDWALRFGRQSLHNWGVLGRFDGAHFSYDWAAHRRAHFTAGYPVESTRDGVRTGRRFLGAAVDFDELIGAWDFSAFMSTQTMEGVDDRTAVGLEARYLDDRRSLTGMLDYDIDYGELNTALVLGTWRFENLLTLTALVDLRMSPVLTTRNALIGQPVTTMEELLLVWTEDEIRELARDRTAESQTVALGLTMPLSERFQINADVTMSEIGETPESGGVFAVPGTGLQTYYSASLVGAGLFGSGDVSIFSIRHGTADDFTLSQLVWDARFPLGNRLRLNPRLRFAVWENIDGRRRETVSPSFRLLFNSRNRYRLEFEIGSDQFTRTELDTVQDSSGYYVSIGYRADF